MLVIPGVMLLDDLGKKRLARTNSVVIEGDVAINKFRNYASLPWLWAFMERKCYEPAHVRYHRQKRRAKKFLEAGLNVPEIIEEDDLNHILKCKRLECINLVDVLKNPDIDYYKKLGHLMEAFEFLHIVHYLKEAHGDPYPKNWGKLVKVPENGKGIICSFDFKHRRKVPSLELEQVIDVLLLSAGGQHILRAIHPGKNHDILDCVRQVYGNDLSFPFTARDRFFYKHRFKVGDKFFDYFQKT